MTISPHPGPEAANYPYILYMTYHRIQIANYHSLLPYMTMVSMRIQIVNYPYYFIYMTISPHPNSHSLSIHAIRATISPHPNSHHPYILYMTISPHPNTPHPHTY
jgi:hypothetical protein